MQPSALLRAVTWNVGGSYEDWNQLIDVTETKSITYRGRRVDFAKRGGSKEQKDLRECIERDVSSEISRLVPDIIFLQEVVDSSRPCMQVFKDANYEFYSFDRTMQEQLPAQMKLKRPWEPGCVVALKRNDRLQFLENLSNVRLDLGRDFACVNAYDKITKKVVTCISGHMPGLKFREGEENQQKRAAVGNTYAQALCRSLSYLNKKPDIILVGIDANGLPERHPTRFRNLVNDFAHEIYGSSEGTNVLLDEADMTKEGLARFTRSLDYIVAIWRSKKHSLPAGTLNHKTDHARALSSFDPVKLSSDHRPLLIELDIEKRDDALAAPSAKDQGMPKEQNSLKKNRFIIIVEQIHQIMKCFIGNIQVIFSRLARFISWKNTPKTS